MTKSKLSAIALSSLLMLGVGVTTLKAQSNEVLLDALVRKKVLSENEADDIREDIAREEKKSSANKIALSNSTMEMKLYGDLRLRYQHDNKQPRYGSPQNFAKGSTGSGDPQHGVQRGRARFRLRLSADFKLTENFFGGVQLQTSNAADSGNQTYTGGFSNYNIYLSKAFLGWKPMDGLTFIGGKQSNPFYTTDLVWDGDINPTGVVEIVEFHKLVNVDEGTSLPWELSLRAGQFIFNDNIEDAVASDYNTDAWLFATQIVGAYKFNKDTKLTVAPGFMFFNASNIASGSLNNETKFENTSTMTQGATRNLHIITAPGDVGFRIGGLKAKVYWDFAYNVSGSKRTRDIYGLNGVGTTSDHSPQDNLAWLAGVQVGDNKKKGDWAVFVNYRQTGIAAVDPNLNDSDFALGQLNMQGVKTGVSYNFTDAVSGAFTYFNAWELRHLTGGEATGGNKIASTDSVQIFQVDLNIKF